MSIKNVSNFFFKYLPKNISKTFQKISQSIFQKYIQNKRKCDNPHFQYTLLFYKTYNLSHVEQFKFSVAEK